MFAIPLNNAIEAGGLFTPIIALVDYVKDLFDCIFEC